MMKARIELLPEKTLVGKSLRMSLVDNKTPELWGSFMRQKKVIQNTVGTDLYSVQEYDSDTYFSNFNPNTEFTKWAAIEVADLNNIPIGFVSKRLISGLYAVFVHKGLVSDFPRTMNYIMGQWLPNSEYVLDNRPHFEVLGTKYKNNSPDSEEEVWIPIKKKS
jgi:AraC family transcriptional regulator